jgi:hypothetical protein
MYTKSFIIFLFFTLLTFSSCKKNDVAPQNDLTIENQTDILQTKFAKILASALADNYELRNLLKVEALKQFDKDNDILYQLIRNEKAGNQTVSELLSSYAESKEDFASIEEKLPLLTILIPTLPDFTPENWNVNSEIPQVAVALSQKGEVPLYDKSGKQTIVPSGYVPAIPVLVVKQNERVKVNSGNSLKSSKNLVGGNPRFSFVDEAFDGSKVYKQQRTSLDGTIDQVNVDAYNLGMEWQRDYVYYGLTPTNTVGAFKNNYSEFLSGFYFVDGAAGIGKISDQTGDPSIPKASMTVGQWTDGYFEFRVTVLINAKNGVGSTLTKAFTAKGRDLFLVTYTRSGFLYKISSVTPIQYNPNLELIPWDLENYGTAWKFIISEFDLSQEVTQTYENTTTYAANFGIEGTVLKIGLKFGASATTSQKNTYSVKTYLNSDELGEAVLTFDQPVITGLTSGSTINGVYYPGYITRDITTGWVNLSIEPRKVF